MMMGMMLLIGGLGHIHQQNIELMEYSNVIRLIFKLIFIVKYFFVNILSL